MNAPTRPALMPPKAPLAMPDQALSRPFRDSGAPHWERRAPVLKRLFVFGFATLMTGGLGLIFADWFKEGGVTGLEWLLIALVVFTFFWIALPVATALVGVTSEKRATPRPVRSLNVALLLPLYGEDMTRVVANARAMLEAVGDETLHGFSLFFLSDTRDHDQVATEKAAVKALRRALPLAAVWYRHRAHNVGFKAGNIRNWVQSHGSAYDAMLVLDADSLMSGAAIRRLTDEMAADPSAGLIQSVPQLVNSRTLWARTQQFSNAIYGGVLARGLAAWSGASANFWGHNAIIRTRAFAASAGLPALSGRGPFSGPILSHDFVEAALIRRAGWAVRFVPEAMESYEETPSSIVAHVMRDRRWCRGNMQHLRLMFTPGLSLISRFHLFQGAMGYISSVGWFVLLVLWALWGLEEMQGIISYFSETNPLFPTWPEMDIVSKLKILGFVYGMLLAPKLIGVLCTVITDPTLSRVGGWRFPVSVLLEILLSVLYAPMMMIQHMIAVFRAFLGLDKGWAPKRAAQGGGIGVAGLVRFHGLELLTGGVMTAACVSGTVSMWLLPIALCLLAAPLLSVLGSLPMPWLFQVPQEVAPPDELVRAAALAGSELPRPKSRTTVPPHAVPAE
jgi:membrane glycosyltransferase